MSKDACPTFRETWRDGHPPYTGARHAHSPSRTVQCGAPHGAGKDGRMGMRESWAWAA